uniref:Phospholipase A(2) n=1 Tax=Parastrongyloides trichosuri TaxID=131310 RepID=A0A0N4ZJ76_PARTI
MISVKEVIVLFYFIYLVKSSNYMRNNGNTSDNNTSIEDEVVPETITYMCGTGLISSWLSKIIASPCGTSILNNCCLDHDVCYDDPRKDQEECDNNFCECIKNGYSKSPSCARWLVLTHCTTVKALGYLPLVSARKINVKDRFIDHIINNKNEEDYNIRTINMNVNQREYIIKNEEEN